MSGIIEVDRMMLALSFQKKVTKNFIEHLAQLIGIMVTLIKRVIIVALAECVDE